VSTLRDIARALNDAKDKRDSLKRALDHVRQAQNSTVWHARETYKALEQCANELNIGIWAAESSIKRLEEEFFHGDLD
jgi:hypothetical protein